MTVGVPLYRGVHRCDASEQNASSFQRLVLELLGAALEEKGRPRHMVARLLILLRTLLLVRTERVAAMGRQPASNEQVLKLRTLEFVVRTHAHAFHRCPYATCMFSWLLYPLRLSARVHLCWAQSSLVVSDLLLFHIDLVPLSLSHMLCFVS